jgi:hypothetical protein
MDEAIHCICRMDSVSMKECKKALLKKEKNEHHLLLTKSQINPKNSLIMCRLSRKSS